MSETVNGHKRFTIFICEIEVRIKVKRGGFQSSYKSNFRLSKQNLVELTTIMGVENEE
jgi:hypothetical protein